jgi:hypothetical protein
VRPQGVAGALFAVAIGAILTYAVSFTVSGVSIHTVGVIIMAVGAVALAILLVRSMTTSRRPVESRRPLAEPGPSADRVYRQDPVHGAPPVAATRISTEVYTAPEQRADQPLYSREAYPGSGTPRQ